MTCRTDMLHKPKPIHLLSGGLDSTVMLHDMIRDGCKPHCLLVYYGQKHFKELDFAKATCHNLGVPWSMQALDKVFAASFLTGGGGSVVVPNRNAVLLHIAAAIAVQKGADSVTFACNADDQGGFPDCTHAFLDAMNATLKAAKVEIEIMAPYIGMTKWQIVQRGKELGVNFEGTWSCYDGMGEPCGKCKACELRNAAFK
jgi:7-cyano-7-deazaguanine synthase